jgi:hypothetical protein
MVWALAALVLAGVGVGVWLIVGSSSNGPVKSLQLGTGYDPVHHVVENPSTSFGVGQTVYVAFTIDTTAAHSTAELMIVRGGVVEDTSQSVSLQKGTHTYEKTIYLGGAGSLTIEVSYNGRVTATTQLNAG